MQYVCLFLLVNVVMYVVCPVFLPCRVKHVFALYFCLYYKPEFYDVCIVVSDDHMFSVFFVIELPVLWYYVKSTPAISCDVNSK